MLASTFMDMVLGLDIHFEIVPMSPAPVPLPNPFVGMVWDPGGLLVSQSMGLAAALLTGSAPTGPVLINLWIRTASPPVSGLLMRSFWVRICRTGSFLPPEPLELVG